MKKFGYLFVIPVLALFISAAFTAAAGQRTGNKVNTISAEALKVSLDDPKLTIIDVRREKHWKSSDSKIAGAIREDHQDVDAWSGNYAKPDPIVLYCA